MPEYTFKQFGIELFYSNYFRRSKNELIRRLVEVLGETAALPLSTPYGSLRIISTLEFLQHHLA
jgi:hypothetical protein